MIFFILPKDVPNRILAVTPDKGRLAAQAEGRDPHQPAVGPDPLGSTRPRG
jgi:hypothetical protein